MGKTGREQVAENESSRTHAKFKADTYWQLINFLKILLHCIIHLPVQA